MYFNLSEAIVDRLDLTIEEKMACVVLARYANNPAFDGLITLSVVAKKMAIDETRTKNALISLHAKGLIGDIDLLHEEAKTTIPVETAKETPKIITAENKHPDLKPAEFKEIKTEEIKPKKVKKASLEEIAEIFEEIVPKNRLKILYNLADKDIDKLKKAYLEVKKEHKFDVISALADYLQQTEIEAETSLSSDTNEHKIENMHESLDFEEAKALLDILENDIDPEEVLKTGKIINRQINLSKVKNAYRGKRKS